MGFTGVPTKEQIERLALANLLGDHANPSESYLLPLALLEMKFDFSDSSSRKWTEAAYFRVSTLNGPLRVANLCYAFQRQHSQLNRMAR